MTWFNLKKQKITSMLLWPDEGKQRGGGDAAACCNNLFKRIPLTVNKAKAVACSTVSPCSVETVGRHECQVRIVSKQDRLASRRPPAHFLPPTQRCSTRHVDTKAAFAATLLRFPRILIYFPAFYFQLDLLRLRDDGCRWLAGRLKPLISSRPLHAASANRNNEARGISWPDVTMGSRCANHEDNRCATVPVVATLPNATQSLAANMLQ